MSDNELLLALSDMMDKKIEPLKSDMRDIKITLENDILPRLQNIESCYTTNGTDTTKRNSPVEIQGMEKA